MFLSKREYFSSQIYSKPAFIKKESVPLAIAFIFINFILKLAEFKKSEFIFEFKILFIFLLSTFCIFFSVIIGSSIRYDIYGDKHNRLGRISYFLNSFISSFLIILGSLILGFDSNPKDTIILTVIALGICFIYSFLSALISYHVWQKKFIYLRHDAIKRRNF